MGEVYNRWAGHIIRLEEDRIGRELLNGGSLQQMGRSHHKIGRRQDWQRAS
jgi:hypothetical protein